VHADAKDDIKQSAESFGKAVRTGDTAAAHKYAITDEQTSKLLDAMTHLTKAHQKMADAAVAKFGDEGKSLGGNNMARNQPQQFTKNLNDADIQVNGDTATVTSKDQRGQQVVFKKDGGIWKLDMTQFPNKEQMQQGLPMWDKMATAMSEVGDEIKAGKYNTAQEAKTALGQKMIAAMRSMAPGAPGAPRGQQ
jgi:hypothetical protein